MGEGNSPQGPEKFSRYKYPSICISAEDGTVVTEDVNTGDIESLKTRVKHAITSNLQLYQDILQYKVWLLICTL